MPRKPATKAKSIPEKPRAREQAPQPKKPVEKPLEKPLTQLGTGEVLELAILRGRELSKQLKTLEKELGEIKTTLKTSLSPGTYIGANGSVLLFEERESFEPPDHEVILLELEKQNKLLSYRLCFKVLTEATKLLLGEKVYNSIKGKSIKTPTLSFR